jgi:hypothetical protein
MRATKGFWLDLSFAVLYTVLSVEVQGDDLVERGAKLGSTQNYVRRVFPVINR